MPCVFFRVSATQYFHADGFPHSFGPLGLAAARTKFISNVAIYWKQKSWSLTDGTQELANNRFIGTSPITLDKFVRAELGIPPEATTFAWSYQVSSVNEACANYDLGTIDFLENGGFMYFNDASACVRVLAVRDVHDGETEIKFDKPQLLDPAFVDSLRKAKRFHPVTVSFLLERGATEYVWISPGEIDSAPHGGFAYICDSDPSTVAMCDWLCFFPSAVGKVPLNSTHLVDDMHHIEVTPRDAQKHVAGAERRRTFSSVPSNRAFFDVSLATEKVLKQLPSAPRVCILGGRNFQDPCSKLLVEAIAKGFARELAGKVVVVTGGLEGIQETFATNFGIHDQVVNVIPECDVCPFDTGKVIKAGTCLQERIEIYGNIGHLYLTIEGGLGVAKEARAACDRGAMVLPMIWTGGASGGMFDFPSSAMVQPDYLTPEEWSKLKEKSTDDPSRLAQSTADVVVSAVTKLCGDGRFDKSNS
eukprot:TRINITY_DN46461_c0_g1_i1.p1 TRINITY_DN46461_c0_g1~~TRINITY_DN46461_c0_g1_i1.p1  ORF type:complete len:475 (+),score=59.61 TRINITY_DN46461_c0_g1_i1:51-1475(+)